MKVKFVNIVPNVKFQSSNIKSNPKPQCLKICHLNFELDLTFGFCHLDFGMPIILSRHLSRQLFFRLLNLKNLPRVGGYYLVFGVGGDYPERDMIRAGEK